jgi:hypothetical protein
MIKPLCVLPLFSLLALPTTGMADQRGGVPVRIDGEPTPECVNGATDRAYITMYRAIITKKKGGFLSSEKQAEIVITIHVSSEPQSSQALTYPLSAKVNIDQYPNGQVSLPVEYTLVNGLALTQSDGKAGKVAYTGFGLNATIVNLRSKNGLGTALDSLQQVTSSGKLPIPSSPYTQAAGYLLDFANKAVSADIESKNSDDKYTTETLALNIDPMGTCASPGPGGHGFERTGVKAILMADGPAGAQLIPIADVNDYCYAADIEPAFVIKATKKRGAIACSDPSYNAQYKAISNDYLAFLLQRRPINTGGAKTLGKPTPAQVRYRKSIEHSMALCKLLGMQSDCKAAEAGK